MGRVYLNDTVLDPNPPTYGEDLAPESLDCKVGRKEGASEQTGGDENRHPRVKDASQTAGNRGQMAGVREESWQTRRWSPSVVERESLKYHCRGRARNWR
ncbi:hypothetical protein KM043_007115 [Ampulex compressa]|nr:hypothetical protein KM043_007115 [Ampulex compressa]